MGISYRLFKFLFKELFYKGLFKELSLMTISDLMGVFKRFLLSVLHDPIDLYYYINLVKI